MNSREILLDRLSSRQPFLPKQCIVGFDGFTDEIIDLVDVRKDVFSFSSIKTMKAFGQRILSAAGKSCNIELVTRKTKVGGNAPIMTQALLAGKHHITFIGAIGQDLVEPLFQPMASRCQRVVPLCRSGHTDALEFSDGKVMLGKMGDLPAINFATILQHISKEELQKLFEEADLFASCNWTMLPATTDIWRQLLKQIGPALSQKRRWMFVDLADPKKRSEEELLEALAVLKEMGQVFDVVLGLNLSEGEQILKGEIFDEPDSLRRAAELLRGRLGLGQVVIHGIRGGAVSTADGTFYAAGFFWPDPRCSTGGGDNFNAGYCQGLLFDFEPHEALAMGVATSGYWVLHGESPDLAALNSFLSSG